VGVGRKVGLTAAAVSVGVMLVGGGALAWRRPWEAGSSTSASHPIGSAGPSSGSAEASPGATSSAAAEPAAPTWLSGASSDESANGTYGSWRGEPIQIGGTWDNGDDEQVAMHSICSKGSWATWNKPLDVAIGAIDGTRGESWAAAARGAYVTRWTKNLTKIKQCWGQRDPSLLYIRFAHEMNLPMHWRVLGGEEASFVKAITLYSNLRYKILPQAKIVLCPNDGTDAGLHGLDIRKLWPGKDAQGRQVANVYAVDSYNMNPHVITHAAFIKKINGQYSNGVPLGIEKHRQFAAKVGAPFAIGEWSNNGDPGNAGGGGESALYVREFYAWAKSHAGNPADPKPGQLLYEVQFNLWGDYAFWPKTVQPKTAAEYRALPWGR